MSFVYTSSAGSRGRGLFTARACPSHTLLPLGEPHAASPMPGCASVCCSCGRHLERPVRCACSAAYCSEACRDKAYDTGHALLCVAADDAARSAASLAELLSLGSDAARASREVAERVEQMALFLDRQPRRFTTAAVQQPLFGIL